MEKDQDFAEVEIGFAHRWDSLAGTLVDIEAMGNATVGWVSQNPILDLGRHLESRDS